MTHRSVPAGRRRIGRGRLLSLALAAGFIAVLFIWIWGVRNLDGLPDVGDPFDVAEARRPIVLSDDDNAYVAYADAKRKLSTFTRAFWRVDLATLTWSKSGDVVRDFVEKNHPALLTWREGSERPHELSTQPGELAIDTILPVVDALRSLTLLAGVQGSRHEEEGAMDEAWSWYRGMLRTSRHVGEHGVIIMRVFGARTHERAARRIIHWAADPRVDARLLRRAFDDTLAADTMSRPLSGSLKLEYLREIRDLEELRVMVRDVPMPGGRFGWIEKLVAATGAKVPIQKIRLHATNDVERSRRVLRLLYANWLAQVDKPAAKRAPIAIRKPTLIIYASDPAAPPAARALAPAVLDKAIDHTSLAWVMLRPDDLTSTGGHLITRSPWEDDGILPREPRNRAVLIVKLAAELYRREHGQFPPTAEALLGPYLKVLPEGVESDDPIPAGLD
ncbi:MAG: hypothetical protein ACHRXM_15295 [Isosphaerales bacterium]